MLFAPLIDREREMRSAVDLLRATRLTAVRVMTASDLYRDEVWWNLLALSERAALESALRGELIEAVRATGRPLKAEPAVLELLHEASGQADREPVATAAPKGVRRRAEAERRQRWKALRRSGQLPAS